LTPVDRELGVPVLAQQRGEHLLGLGEAEGVLIAVQHQERGASAVGLGLHCALGKLRPKLQRWFVFAGVVAMKAPWKIVLYCAAALLFASPTLAAAPPANPPAATGPLSDLETLVKIIGGVIAAFVAIVGLPAAFLQFGKTSAEIRKLRLEAEKLAKEATASDQAERISNRTQISISHSPNFSLSVRSDAGLLGPMLILVDFVVASVTYGVVNILIGMIPIYLLIQPLKLIGFGVLFIPVYQNARQVRDLLRRMAELDEATETVDASPPTGADNTA
jgi:hypothetical protein